ncbi:MAG: phage tail protein [Deltaproteobacteria bacterium]|nr:phage tail protein [Deltaproteobacteria bacterium]
MASDYDDPFGNFNFHVELGDDGVKALFNEIGGIKGDVEEFEIKEGGVNDRTYKAPGRVSWGPVTLKRGVDAEGALYKWWRQVVTNDKGGGKESLRRTVVIRLLDDDRQSTLKSWKLKEAWPKSWEGPSFNSGGSELAFESITLNHHGVEES